MSNPTIDLMQDHRSVRAYEPAGVDRSTIVEAVKAAQMASTSSNVQAYCALNVTDTDQRHRLAELCGNQRQVAESGAFLVICADARRHGLLAERQAQSCAQNLETFLVAIVDASLFAQNLALAFESEGLGICYIGGVRNALEDVDELLDLPKGVMPLFGMCVGVPRSRPGRKPRLPVEAVLFDNLYPDDASMLDMIDAYDATMEKHYGGRGAEGRTWSGAIVRRYYASRRNSLAAYYESKGARLI